jgi:hypothetical protein
MADGARQSREKKWRDLYKAYRSYAEPRKDGLANVFIPESFTLVETVVPRVIDAMFGSYPYVSMLPVGPEDVDSAKSHEALLNFQLDERIKIVEKFAAFLKECLIYGTAVGMVPWRLDRRPMKQWGLGFKMVLGFLPIPARVPVTKMQVLYDDPDFVHIDLIDFWIDPYAESIDAARFCIVRSWVDLAHLKRKEADGLYSNVSELENTFGSQGAGERGASLRLGEVGISQNEAEDSKDKPIEVLSIWEDDRLTVIADHRVVLSEGENPYWDGRKPSFSIRDNLIPHEFYGIGEIEPNLGLNEELNTIRNQRLKWLNVALDLMFMVNRNADIDEDELRSRPGGIIHLDSFDDLKQLDVSKDVAAAFAEERSIRESIQSTSGVYDYNRGATPARGETATTVVSLQQAGEMRFKLKTRLFEYTGLRELARFMAARNMQYMDRARAIRILGPAGVEFLNLKPDDICGSFDYTPAGSSVEPMANRQVAQNNWLNLYDRLKTDPQIDQVRLKKKLFEVHGVKDAERFLVQMPPPTPFDPLNPLALGGLAGGVTPGRPAEPTPIGPPDGGVNKTPGVVMPPNVHQPRAKAS